MTLPRKTLLVYGYIREIKSIFVNNGIVPNEIINLCQMFFITSNKIFFQLREYQSVHILDMSTNEMSKLFDKCHYMSNVPPPPMKVACYIKNISQYLNMSNLQIKAMGMDPNKAYDGIVGIKYNIPQHIRSIKQPRDRMLQNYKYPLILFFESNKIDDAVIYFHTCISSIPCHNFHQSIFCGERHGIIYESNGALYQCKLQDIAFDAIDSDTY